MREEIRRELIAAGRDGTDREVDAILRSIAAMKY